MKYYTNIDTLKLIYHNLIESNVLYGLQIWGSASKSNLIPLINTLEGILKILVPKKYKNHNHYETLNILSLEDLYIYHFAIAHYFDFKEETRHNLTNSLRPRNTLQLIIPEYNNKHGKRTTKYLTQSIFSNIPKEYLNETTFNSAKTKIKYWLKNKNK